VAAVAGAGGLGVRGGVTMAAEYLVRFDDVCPTMNWEAWDRVESILTSRGMRPLLAVVPDNRDPKLQVAPAREDFWERVRQWQERQWTIALHGYQHVYETRAAGLVGLNDRSEFAGVAAEEQARRLGEAVAIFRANGIAANTWIAPAHSFDKVTLAVLRDQGITRLSDGLFFHPGRDASGILWVPQQLWDFRRRPFGVWPVCLHINSWTARELDRFEESLDRFAPAITDFETVCAKYASRRLGLADRAIAAALLFYGRH